MRMHVHAILYLARLHMCTSIAFTCKHLHTCYCMCEACEEWVVGCIQFANACALFHIALFVSYLQFRHKREIHTTKRGNHGQPICSSHFTQWYALQMPSSFILFHILLLLLLEHFLFNDTSVVMISSSICLVTDKPQHMWPSQWKP